MSAALVIGVPVGLFVICAGLVALRELGRAALSLVVAWLWGEIWWGS